MSSFFATPTLFVGSVSIANGANFALPNTGGLSWNLTVSEDTAIGDAAIYLLSAGSVKLIGELGTIFVEGSTPGAGEVGVAHSGSSVYSIYNNRGGTSTFSYRLERVRPS